MDVYIVLINSDITEGRGQNVLKENVYFDDLDEAVAYARSKEPYGHEVKINDNHYSRACYSGGFTEVIHLVKHGDEKYARMMELKRNIKKMQEELNSLKGGNDD